MKDGTGATGAGGAPVKRARIFPVATLGVALVALGAAACPAASVGLEFERAALLRGELWRLWTAHLVHFGASHAAWNLAVFVPAGVWLERLAPARLRGLLVVAPVLISGALLACEPALERYAGLSGVATAVLVLLALTKLERPGSDRLFWCGVLAVIALKMVVESVGARPVFAVFDSPGVSAVPLAHVAGAGVAGLAWLAARWRGTKPRVGAD